MRKVTSETVNAFMRRQKARVSNTRTDGESYFLHGNKIAWWKKSEKADRDDLWVSNAGWDTKTTRERLNWVLGKYHPSLSIFRSKGVTMLSALGEVEPFISPTNITELLDRIERMRAFRGNPQRGYL